ncbi:prolyl oligopeptidase family serine peptidase [Winogradskyella sp.]|uniref:prolyl oligopeptidase family serine peptidase n=1 Tax=Winogradskyella sp. TaxID=1883156 RepID=UPI003BA9DE67
MKTLTLSFLACLTTVLYAQNKPKLMPERAVTDNYHGQQLEDPYRYMENLQDQDVLDWMKANTKYAEDIMSKVPGKQDLKNLMISLFMRQGDRISNVHITDNDGYFYINKKAGEEFGKLYKRSCFSCEEILLFDPKDYKPENDEKFTIYGIQPNYKGNLIAVAFAANGSENAEIQLMDANGQLLKDFIALARGVSWLPKDDAFIYTKANSADVTEMDRYKNLTTYVHYVGTDPMTDKVILSRKNNPDLDIGPDEFPSARYDADANKFIGYAQSVDNRLKTYIADYDENSVLNWQPMTKREDQIEVAWVGTDHMYYMSFNNAPNKKILKAPIDQPSVANATLLVPEKPDETITDMAVTTDGLYYVTTKNGVEAHGYFLPNKGQEMKLKFPFTAGFANVSTKNSRSSDVWFTISGWTSPNKRYRYHPESNTFELEELAAPVEFPELDNIRAKEVMITSHDGVKVPVSIIYDKTIQLDGSNTAVLLGYGAYGISMEPNFSPLNLVLTSYGVVFVVPHVRGGGELGADWHKAGQKLTKPNTWKDAIATAEYLIENGYTSKGKIGIAGGSAGGVFVGRAITERPDLFQAAAPMVGCMNTVRQEASPNGPINIPEFGTVKDADEFKGLLEMDSFHHIVKGVDYPALWISAGMNDPRVIAWQPAKFAARIQAADQDEEPILLFTDFEGGHGGGVAFSKTLEEFSNVFSFMLWQTGHPKFQPSN